MYVPAHFAPDDDSIHSLLADHGAADLVTSTPDGLIATMLPFIYDREQGKLLVSGEVLDRPGADPPGQELAHHGPGVGRPQGLLPRRIG